MAWNSIADLIALTGEVALLGAPMEAGSVTPGRCDLAPAAVRRTLKRFSTYDVESRAELGLALADLGDVPVQGLLPADGYEPIRNAAAAAVAQHRLTLLIGGNNAVTRPAAHALGVPLDKVGLITLDAHFDLRETDQGLLNGNPIRALLEDGLPGRNICQVGLAPFANTAKMHQDAEEAGIGVYTITDCLDRGIGAVLAEALARLDHTDSIMVDFDIDVIDRGQCPGAPGARPGGMPVRMFFEAARWLGAQPRISLVDLTEFDPSLDVGDITALTAGRWVCEILAGFSHRDR
ncbi:arginase family protein [Sphingosinicella sp. BN140058]|uniref:arginase family protein n=1 Tax=Sphingosinicella sp. BN140058 TaxID=1892855 RepID=UPI00197FB891|nr:arginase family protein [Sphingosinicella sp. BN140058]